MTRIKPRGAWLANWDQPLLFFSTARAHVRGGPSPRTACVNSRMGGARNRVAPIMSAIGTKRTSRLAAVTSTPVAKQPYAATCRLFPSERGGEGHFNGNFSVFSRRSGNSGAETRSLQPLVTQPPSRGLSGSTDKARLLVRRCRGTTARVQRFVCVALSTGVEPWFQAAIAM